MKKLSILSCAMATIIGITAGNPFIEEFKGTIAYASSKPTNPSVVSKEEAEVVQELAQLTAHIIIDDEVNSTDRAVLNPRLIELYSANIQTATKPQARNSDKQGLTPNIYEEIIHELMNVGKGQNQPNNKVNLDGNIRIHHVTNSGDGRLGQDSSGIRVYLGANSEINKDWQAYALLEGQKSISNYNNFFKLSRFYAAGKVGKARARIGSFGYLMADGNIYDSGYKGVKIDFGSPLKYTFSYGETDYTKETYVATAKYNDYDYDLEAGVYHYKKDSGASEQNTILTVGGNYNFSNFGVGAMYLDASLKDSRGDSDGYVISFKYGDLKTYRPDTYDIFAKYYNQSSGTYIAHGMNGLGGRMQGFKGYGLGMNYTLAQNFTAGIEYYNLSDKISRGKSQSWWSHLTHYF